ncbi:MAG: hypothetical protein ABFC84_16675 [Veillonellales bacterium]
MRKFLFFLLISISPLNIGNAAIISYNALTSDTGVSYAYLNDAYSKIYNDYNGNIDATNLLDSGVTDADLATAIKFSNWYTEGIGDWTYTGMLPATSATLISDISAGTSYVTGARIVTNATSKTYTASRDTYVYIDNTGAFQYSAVANGATQPSNPLNSLLLAKVVTDATSITSVTDMRQLTPPNLRVYQDIKSGALLSRDAGTATLVTIGRGEIEFGSSAGKVRRNTANANVSFAASGRGGLDTGSLAQGYYYIYAVADDDNSNNFEGIASTSATDATGVTGERLVGWCYAPSASTISVDSIGAYRGLGGDAPNHVVIRGYTDTSTNYNTAHRTIPDMEARFYSSGRPVKITFTGRFNGDNANTKTVNFAISADSVGLTSETAKFADGAAVSTNNINVKWYGTLSAGTHTIDAKWKPSANNYVYQNATIEGPRMLEIEEY